jgi:hypothetical protein
MAKSISLAKQLAAQGSPAGLVQTPTGVKSEATGAIPRLRAICTKMRKS